MKNLILCLTFLSSAAWAGGNGGGTMSPNMNSARLLNKDGIVFYQGQINDNIYFQYGTQAGKKWKVEQFKIEATHGFTTATEVLEALEASKQYNEWVKVLPTK